MLTPRENFLRFLRNEACEWTPTSMDQLAFRPDIVPDNICRGFVTQQQPFRGKYGGKDAFGCDWVFEDLVGGAIETGALFEDIEDWEDIVVFPDLDSWDWAGCAEENREYLQTDKLITSTIFTGFFERLISFIGFENSAMALVDEDQQPYVHRLFDRLADLYIDMLGRMKKYFNIELVDIHDDWGTQRSPMFSVETHTEMIAPYIRKVVEGAHAAGVYMEQHSCGMIEPLIPNLIDTGMDTWRGQNLCDKEKLVGLYGDRFKFGVELRPETPVDDESALALVEDAYERYRGKRIWLAIMGRTFTPAQTEKMYAYVRQHGVI